MNGLTTPAADASPRGDAAPDDVPAPHPPLPSFPDGTRGVSPHDAREMSKIFFARLQELEEGTAAYQYVRNTLIELNLTLVQHVAARFRRRPELREELVQVGTIGLIKAVDRFDVTRDVEFSTFAIPCITGEIKRFFRDTSWAVHVPRRLQELRIALAAAGEELEERLRRAPTTKELAEHLDLTPGEVIEGKVAANGYTAHSFDVPAQEGGSTTTGSALAERVGRVDSGLEAVEDLHALKPILARLDDRDQRILQMRFGDELTQSEIGTELGISQMHVSRLLSRCLARIRAEMTAN